MFGLEALDVLIGLITIYLSFGLACTAIIEALASCLKLRSGNLELAMNEFLSGSIAPDKPFVKAFYEHPLVQSLSRGDLGRPSYIPANIAGQVIHTLLLDKSSDGSISKAIEALPGSPQDNRIKGLLQALLTEVEDDSQKFRQAVETHFDMGMDRACGWFKRKTQLMALIVSSVLVLWANVDSIAIVSVLSANPEARARLVVVAEEQLEASRDPKVNATEKTPIEIAVEKRDQAVRNLQASQLSFGWENFPTSWAAVFSKAIGLIISIMAVSLGAPFWFDVLQRFMKIRSSGFPPRLQEADKQTGGSSGQP